MEDYLSLPEEKRVELIDGVIYDMSAPRYLHQKIAGEVHRQIANFILDRGGSCEVYIAPADVPQICGYNEPIPVRIYGGELSIDPKHIARCCPGGLPIPETPDIRQRD